MKCLFIVNSSTALLPEQTTTRFVAAMAVRGHQVHVASVDAVSLDVHDRLIAWASPIVSGMFSSPRELCLERGDLILIRTNPALLGHDPGHAALLDMLAISQRHGVVVVNDPTGLRRASSKLYSHRIPPELRPKTLVSRDPEALRRFVEARAQASVLKPLVGTRGADVFKVDAAEPNLNQIIDVLVRGGFVMAQEFIPEAVDGDARVVVLDGAALTVNGAVAAIHRVPSGVDFRSNVHAGAIPRPMDYTPRLRRVVEAVGPLLAADGLALCGLDVIGDKVVEINVFSTGGLPDANQFYGVDFFAPVIESLERQMACAAAA